MIIVDQHGFPQDWAVMPGVLRQVQVFVTRGRSGELVEVGVIDTAPVSGAMGSLQTLLDQL